jgi:hypothetical protein
MPRGRKAIVDSSLLKAALAGYEQMHRNLKEKMAEIRRQLGVGDGTRTQAATATAGAKRRLSVAARRRIAAAQRKRWALAKAKQTKPKRTMSAATRKIIAAAQWKRWGAARKAQAKAVTKRAVKKAAFVKVAPKTAKAA